LFNERGSEMFSFLMGIAFLVGIIGPQLIVLAVLHHKHMLPDQRQS
jgi:hypothetical protein